MSFAKDRRLLRTIQLACLAAALATIAACKGPDPSTFACSSSAECPGDYHCDLGTASTTGSFKCVSGAPTPRTLAAEASKFLLSKRPSADGSTRTTILANLGAVTSTPDFVGVRLIASQAGHDLADSPVAADGSVLEFQLPQATAQVSLRVQDDSGHSVPVTGYPEQVELTFAGKEVTGNTNPTAAYDVTTTSDSLHPPASWISGGPGADGGIPPEFAANDTLLPDGGVQSASSYSSLAYLDYRQATSATPPNPLDPSATSPGSSVGWQEFATTPTAQGLIAGPAARVGATLSSASGIVLYGGADLAGNAVDPAGSFYRFDTFNGWTQVIPPAGPAALPSSGARGGVGLGSGGGTGCPSLPCTQLSLQFSMAGGVTNAAGAMTNKVVAFGTRSDIPASGPALSTTGWFDVGTMPFANAGMASAAVQVPISNSTTAGSFENFAGLVMVGGAGIISGGGPANSNDVNGCMVYAGFPNFSTSPVANRSFSCADANFNTASGAIGFRSGVTLVPIDSTTFLLFGGNKINGAGGNGPKSDLWQGKLSCTVIAPASICTTQVVWTPLSPTGTLPPPRTNAGGAIWETTFTFSPTFTINRKMVIYGGTDGTGGALNDLWEYDLPTNAWRQLRLDAGTALTPATRTRLIMTGDGSHAYLFGGLIGGAATDQMWFASREGTARILVKAPVSLPSVDTATGMKVTIDVAGAAPSSFSTSQAYLWDGTKWRFVGTGTFDAAGAHLVATPLASGTGFLQPDGNIYLLLVQPQRSTPQFGGSEVGADRVKMTVDFK